MCLSTAFRVDHLLPDCRARVRSAERDLDISLLALDQPVAVGDWVLVHSGFALAVLSADEVRDALAIAVMATKESP